MTWIDIAWPAMGGVSLTLGLLHLLIWQRQRDQPALLMFGLAAGSLAVLAIIELLGMHAQTTARYFTLLRWGQVPVTAIGFALVGFVLLHFRVGRPWLGLAACVLRAGVLLASSIADGSLHFREVTDLVHVDLWGATAAVPVGIASPALLVTGLADLMLVLFFVDAIASAWRRTLDPSGRRRVALVCGSMILFVVVTSGWATLVAVGWLHAPFAVTMFCLAVLIVMSYELGGSVVHATKLERQLEESESNLRGSEQRLQFTADAVGLGMWTWEIDQPRVVDHGNRQRPAGLGQARADR